MNECTIECDNEGWYVSMLNGAIVESGFPTCGDAVEAANEYDLTITNMDDVDRWMQPPDDWGIIEG